MILEFYPDTKPRLMRTAVFFCFIVFCSKPSSAGCFALKRTCKGDGIHPRGTVYDSSASIDGSPPNGRLGFDHARVQ